MSEGGRISLFLRLALAIKKETIKLLDCARRERESGEKIEKRERLEWDGETFYTIEEIECVKGHYGCFIDISVRLFLLSR